MIEAIIFDWYGTLAAPDDNDFWNRMPQIIEGAGGRVLPIAEWEASPVEHEAHLLNEETYRAWQEDRLMTLFRRSGIAERLSKAPSSHFQKGDRWNWDQT